MNAENSVLQRLLSILVLEKIEIVYFDIAIGSSFV